MARIITKELAEKIAKKLRAEVVVPKSGPHDIAYVYHRGVLVAQFGIRRGSEKDKGHDHIPRDLHIGPNKARLLGQCPWKLKDWLRAMVEQRLLEDPELEAEEQQ